jgi:outer membrane protein OmpA-like peptidoglycan-associated protein
MRKPLVLTAAVLGISVFAFGQKKGISESVIENGDFEGCMTRGLKGPGMIEDACKDWFSANAEPADIYATDGKAGKAGVENAFGKQTPNSGERYGGFRAYSKDPKYGRSYLSIKLKSTLEKDAVYCVKYQVSLSELSKVSVNSLGAWFPDKKTVVPNKGDIIRQAQVVDRSKDYGDMDGWMTVCGHFTATGKESYVVIGCFDEEKSMKLGKPKKPASFPGTQIMHAYYYVDDLEINKVESASNCFCKAGGAAANREPDLVYSKSIAFDENASAADIIRASAVYFAYGKAEPNGAAQRDLDQLAELLKKNRNLTITVHGHCDENEWEAGQSDKDMSTLAQDRADNVAEYLISKGVDSMKVLPRSKNNTEPASTMKTPMSQAQNRRVTFSVR